MWKIWSVRRVGKNGTRGGGRASKEKGKINNSDDYKVQNTQKICVSIGTRLK